MKWACVQNGVVTFVADEDFSQALGVPMIPCPDDVQLDWTYDSGTQTFAPPPPPPLTRPAMENYFLGFISQKQEQQRLARLEQILKTLPYYPDIPATMPDFQDILDGLDWTELP